MATIKLSPTIADITGSNGNTVFTRSHTGISARARVKPINPRSSRQSVMRAYLAAASAGWDALSDATRALWRASAATLTESNKVGEVMHIQPNALFCGINAARLASGGAIVSATVPTGFAVAPIGTFTVSAASGLIVTTLSNLASLPTGSKVMHQIAGPFKGGRWATAGPWSAITTISISAYPGTPTTLQSSANSASGQVYFVKTRCVDYTGNTISKPTIQRVIMTA